VIEIADELAPWLRRTRFCTSRARPRTTPSLASIVHVPFVVRLSGRANREVYVQARTQDHPRARSDFAFGQSYVTTPRTRSRVSATPWIVFSFPTTTDSRRRPCKCNRPPDISSSVGRNTGAPLMQRFRKRCLHRARVTGLANIATYPFYGTSALVQLPVVYVQPVRRTSQRYSSSDEQKYSSRPTCSRRTDSYGQMLVRAIHR